MKKIKLNTLQLGDRFIYPSDDSRYRVMEIKENGKYHCYRVDKLPLGAKTSSNWVLLDQEELVYKIKK